MTTSRTRSASRSLAVTAAAAAGALGLVGCSSGSNSSISKLPPPQAVDTAAHNLFDQPGLGMRLTLGLTQAQVQQVSAQNGGSKISDQEAKALSDGAFVLTVVSGHGEPVGSAQARTDSADSYDFALQLGSDTPIDLRYVGQSIYLQLNLQQLLTDVGQSPSKAAKFQSSLQQADQYVPGLKALGAGNWVEVSHSDLQSLGSLLKQYESQAGVNTNSASTRAAGMKLVQDFQTALQANATYANVGNSSGRDHYTMTLNLKGFLTSFAPALQSDLSSVIPSSVGSRYTSSLGDIQSKLPVSSATADLYVADNKLSEADLDINQFLTGKDHTSFPIPLRVQFSSPSAPSAPSGATTLDLSKLPALIQGLLQKGLSSGGSSSSSSATPTTTGSGA